MIGTPLLATGPSAVIREAVPPSLVPVFVGITHLGNVVFLLGLFTVDYWFGDHRRGAHALSLALAGMALITALKAYFVHPRPAEELRLIAASGYSFPSGHATISAIGYGVLAYDFEVGNWRVRSAVAGLVVVLVALSRVVLGVHYLRDVVAGIVVGFAFLALAILLTKHAPRSGFLLAAVLGVGALLVSGASQDSVAELGAIVGAAVAWESVGTTAPVASRRETVVLLGGGLPVFVGITYLSLFGDLPLAVVFLLNSLLLAGVVLAPLLVTRYVREESTDRSS